jgi:hypothetical protein
MVHALIVMTINYTNMNPRARIAVHILYSIEKGVYTVHILTQWGCFLKRYISCFEINYMKNRR